jgi:hypothetical protein
MDFQSSDLRYNSFHVTFRMHVEGVTVSSDDSNSLMPYTREAHTEYVRVGERLFVRDISADSSQWFDGRTTVTFSRGAGGEGVLLIERGEQRPFDPETWMYEPQPGASLPFGSGLGKVKWDGWSANKGKGSFGPFAVEATLKEGATPSDIAIQAGKGFDHHWSYADFRPVEGGGKVPFQAKLRTQSELWKKADFETESFAFLAKDAPLPSYPWDKVDKIADNRKVPNFTVTTDTLKRANGNRPPTELSELLGALDKIRPRAEVQLANIETQNAAARAKSDPLNPLMLGAVALPILLFSAYVWSHRARSRAVSVP